MFPISNGIYNPYMFAGNPYMMGMTNPYMMMSMPPQNLEQYENKQKLMTNFQTDQISFMGKVNPFLNVSKDVVSDTKKGLFNYQTDINEVLNPYSSKNVGSAEKMLDAVGDYQKSMMFSPFGLGYGCPVIC